MVGFCVNVRFLLKVYVSWNIHGLFLSHKKHKTIFQQNEMKWIITLKIQKCRFAVSSIIIRGLKIRNTFDRKLPVSWPGWVWNICLMMEIQECIFPPSVCVAGITVTGCEVRKQVRPSFLLPPHWLSQDSGMSADCLNRRLSAGGDHESPSSGEEKEPDRSWEQKPFLQKRSRSK